MIHNQLPNYLKSNCVLVLLMNPIVVKVVSPFQQVWCAGRGLLKLLNRKACLNIILQVSGSLPGILLGPC